MRREKSRRWKSVCIMFIALHIFNPFRKSVYKLFFYKERFIKENPPFSLLGIIGLYANLHDKQLKTTKRIEA